MVGSVPRFEESQIPLQHKVGGCWIAGRLLSHLAFRIFEIRLTVQIYNQNKKIADLTSCNLVSSLKGKCFIPHISFKRVILIVYQVMWMVEQNNALISCCGLIKGNNI